MQVLKVKYETVLKQKVLSKMSLETRVAKPEFFSGARVEIWRGSNSDCGSETQES